MRKEYIREKKNVRNFCEYRATPHIFGSKSIRFMCYLRIYLELTHIRWPFSFHSWFYDDNEITHALLWLRPYIHHNRQQPQFQLYSIFIFVLVLIYVEWLYQRVCLCILNACRLSECDRRMLEICYYRVSIDLKHILFYVFLLLVFVIIPFYSV